MPLDSAPWPLTRRNALLAIATGGLIAGTVDLVQAMVLFGGDIPLAIAAGLLGPAALQGSVGTYVIGVLLHYLIACTFAAVYVLASRRLPFLLEHALVCGLVFGILVELVMNLGVLPLSALKARGPYELRDLLQGFGIHMVTVGAPIALTARWFAGRRVVAYVT